MFLRLFIIFCFVSSCSRAGVPHKKSSQRGHTEFIQKTNQRNQKYLNKLYDRYGHPLRPLKMAPLPWRIENNAQLAMAFLLASVATRVSAGTDIVSSHEPASRAVALHEDRGPLSSWITHTYESDSSQLALMGALHHEIVRSERIIPECRELPQLSSLEKSLESFWNTKIDIEEEIGFKDFLAPNEICPIRIVPFLNQADKGLVISVGTERSFIDLALCENCTGLIGVDFNPRVVAYNFLNVLLLRVSTNRADYLKLRKLSEAKKLIKHNRLLMSKGLPQSTASNTTPFIFTSNSSPFSL